MRFSPHPLTLRQLQYAVAVAQAKSFRRAAEICHVSQPALSTQVALLEHTLGVRLFERDKRRVMETPAGARVLEKARALLADADALVDAAQQGADPFAGTLRLGVIPTIGPYLLPEVAPALRRRYPRLRFVWLEEKTAVLRARLAAGELDGAIVALESELGDVEHAVICSDPFLLAAPRGHPLARGARAVPLAALEGERVLLLEDGHCFRDQALSLCARAGAAEAELRATSLGTLVQTVAGGEGVTLLPRLAAPVENRRGALHLRPFAAPRPARTLALVWRRGSPARATLLPLAATLAELHAARAARSR